MMAPLVSVLMPVRDASGFLPRALESLSAQSLASHEVIVVDDGSGDGGRTVGVLRGFAGRDSRVRPVLEGRRGIAHALNVAASLARGKYLARMDADDECHPRRLELQAAFLDADPGVDAAGCLVRFGGDREAAAGYARHVDWLNGLLDHEAMALGVFQDAPIAHPSAMFRADSFRRYGGYVQGPFPEDYELWLRWIERGARLSKTPCELLTWNDPPDRLSRQDPRYAPEAFSEIKAGYLARWLARNNFRHPEVLVVGAGRITRRRAEWLCGHGVRIAAYLDIDPRKIGRSLQGRPVLHHRDVPPVGEAFVVSYVSTPGAAQYVAGFLGSRGYAAGRDYVLAG